METIKNNITEEYLAVSQLTDLIQDIENCASRLVEAAKKAKENAKLQAERIKKQNTITES